MSSKGFTLIEILTVILLIGIMSAIAIPRFEKRIELEELKHEKKFTYTYRLLSIVSYFRDRRIKPTCTLPFFAISKSCGYINRHLFLNIDCTNSLSCEPRNFPISWS